MGKFLKAQPQNKAKYESRPAVQTATAARNGAKAGIRVLMGSTGVPHCKTKSKRANGVEPSAFSLEGCNPTAEVADNTATYGNARILARNAHQIQDRDSDTSITPEPL